MTESGALGGADSRLRLARRHLSEPSVRARSPLAALGAAALAAAGGLGAAWMVVFGPSFPDPASAEPVTAVIAAPAVSTPSALGSS